MEIRWPSGRKKIDTFLQIPSHTVVIVHITHLPKPVTFDIILMAARSTSFEQRCRWALGLVSLKLKFLPTGVPGCHMVWGGQNIKVTNMVATITRQTYPPILVPQMCASMCFMPSPSGRGSQFRELSDRSPGLPTRLWNPTIINSVDPIPYGIFVLRCMAPHRCFQMLSIPGSMGWSSQGSLPSPLSCRTKDASGDVLHPGCKPPASGGLVKHMAWQPVIGTPIHVDHGISMIPYFPLLAKCSFEVWFCCVQQIRKYSWYEPIRGKDHIPINYKIRTVITIAI